MLNLAYDIDDTIIIDGVKYIVDMSFDNILRLLDMLGDDDLQDATQVIIGVRMLLDIELELPLDKQEEVLYTIFKEFVGLGAEAEESVDIEGNPMPAIHKESKRMYSLTQDADYIYASFMQDYGIDLFEQQGELHWYKFQALLGGLREDTKFKKVLEIRGMELPTGKGTSKQRESIKAAQKELKLKDE